MVQMCLEVLLRKVSSYERFDEEGISLIASTILGSISLKSTYIQE